MKIVQQGLDIHGKGGKQGYFFKNFLVVVDNQRNGFANEQ